MKRLYFIIVPVSIAVLLMQLSLTAQALPAIQAGYFKKDTFSITQFGSVADGSTLCKKAINAAIDACNINDGGTVWVLPGLWLSGPLVIKAYTNLRLAANALLQLTDDPNQCPLVEGNWEGLFAKKSWQRIVQQFIKVEDGQTDLCATVKVSGLGGSPHRDGGFEYYMHEPVIINDPKGVGAFILPGNEMEMLLTLAMGRSKKVLLNNYFNNEYKKDAFGQQKRFHYTWEDSANSSFSLFGSIFRQYGAKTETVRLAPAAAWLKDASVCIITDPDTDKETTRPNSIARVLF
ncbi:MAG: glycoside hydrolase family 88 protein [Bacteroidota bacterium]